MIFGVPILKEIMEIKIPNSAYIIFNVLYFI